jgi:hypothetical protein
VNSLLTRKEERQSTKKRANLFGNSISNVFATKGSCKKMMRNKRFFGSSWSFDYEK